VTIYPEIDGWRLSLGGTAMPALTHFLEQCKFQNPIAHCVICTDRDTAGHLAYSNISNSKYKMLFTIKDGENIKFNSGYDGKESETKCRWIDKMHTEIGKQHLSHLSFG
jgi:hypothetical protein